MRIRFLSAIASADWAYAPGQVCYIERELAQKWISSGVAISLEPPNSEATRAPEPDTVTAKPRSQELWEELENSRKALERKRAELADTRDAAEGAAVDGILSGKKSRAPALLSKARELESQIEELQSSLTPLERAWNSVRRDENEAASRAEEALCAELHLQHRAAVGTLIEAIESADPLAGPRILEAEMEIARIRFQFPTTKQPREVIVHNAATISYDEQGRLNLYARLCEAGFSDLFPVGHLARRRYEHQQAHELHEHERASKDRAKRLAAADACLIPNEIGTLPNRSPRMTHR